MKKRTTYRLEEFRDDLLASSPEFAEEYYKHDLCFDISNIVLEARLHKQFSQEKLAQLAGTHQSSIARLENGATLPSLSFLEKLAVAMGTYLVPPTFGFLEEIKRTANVTQIVSYPEVVSSHKEASSIKSLKRSSTITRTYDEWSNNLSYVN